MKGQTFQPARIDGYRGRFPMRACRAFVWFVLIAFAVALIAAPIVSYLL